MSPHYNNTHKVIQGPVMRTNGWVSVLKHSVFPGILILLLSTLAGPVDSQAQQRPRFLADEASYHWPTNASRYMSSSFGETRSAHFHAAMDIGTWGHEGYAVFAARDGIVERVAIGPVGYGNVIYLHHDDGTISLYAHLKDFHPRIRHVVDSLRFLDYSFDFDRNLESFDIRFRKGQQIGWTGSTGVGPPHLHFELRSPEGRPFNPFLAGLRVDDSIPPRFSGLSVEPLSATSSVNGSAGIHRVRPTPRGGAYDFGTLDVEGEVGLAVNVFDRANASNNIHAVYELRMYVNEELYFHSRADSFSYYQTRQMFLDRIFPILRNERRGYQRLYVREGNTLPFYRDTGHSGRLDLPPGEHAIRIVASDFFGNRALAHLRLRVSEASLPMITEEIIFPRGYTDRRMDFLPRSPTVFSSPSGTGTESGVKARVGYDSPADDSPARPPSTLIWHKDWVRPGPGTAMAAGTDFITLRPLGTFQQEMRVLRSSSAGLPLDLADRMELRKGPQSWILHRIRPEHPVTIYLDHMRVSVHFPIDAFFEPVSMGITGDNTAFSLFPDIEPFRRPAMVRILLDETWKTQRGVGLYRIHPRNGKLSHVSSRRDQERGVLMASIRSAGEYVIQQDTLGPEIENPSIGKWSHIDRYFLTVEVDDERSGIDYRSAVLYVNGERGIAEYDPENKLLRYHHPGFRPQRVNEVSVSISDRAGNVTEQVFTGVRYN